MSTPSQETSTAQVSLSTAMLAKVSNISVDSAGSGPATRRSNLDPTDETKLVQMYDPDGVDARYPGRKKIKRAQLKAHGTWQEIHCDGHEKLGALALRMGGVGLPIYGMKDKWGGEILYLCVIPDDRHSDVIAHVFLDFIETYGGELFANNSLRL